MSRPLKALFFCGLLLCGTLHAATYMGNGASGFNGSVGNSSLTITDSSGELQFTLTTTGTFTGTMPPPNDLVIYIDSVTGGFGDTSQFTGDTE